MVVNWTLKLLLIALSANGSTLKFEVQLAVADFGSK